MDDVDPYTEYVIGNIAEDLGINVTFRRVGGNHGEPIRSVLIPNVGGLSYEHAFYWFMGYRHGRQSGKEER